MKQDYDKLLDDYLQQAKLIESLVDELNQCRAAAFEMRGEIMRLERERSENQRYWLDYWRAGINFPVERN